MPSASIARNGSNPDSPIGAGNDQTTVADEGDAEKRNALPRVGQCREHCQVPEQDLEQERQVSDDLDIDFADACQQPLSESRHNATMNPITVAKTMPTTETTSVLRSSTTNTRKNVSEPVYGISVSIDVEARIVPEEAEAGGNVLVLEVGAGVGDDLIGNPAQHRREGKLDGDAVPAGLAAQHAPDLQRDLGGGLRASVLDRRGRRILRISGSAARTGDRPCSRDC